ncbi:ion transporter [Bacteroides sp. 519]|uniref:ion transporter n=1 Tax=Bacteroides sp. 519 TaxID=2302937 RepID=UPI0013D45CA3|nr:ion transporter [Bacteroides sp. 519]
MNNVIATIKKLFFNDKFILILIFLNAIIIFIQEFNNIPIYIYRLDNYFTLIFLVEIILKSNTYGLKKYLKSNWNKLDFVVVSLSFASLLLSYVYSGNNISIEFIISLRVLRIFKSVRLLKFIPNINLIINGVNNALKTSSLIILSFIILIFIVSVVTCSIYKNIAPEYFANPLLSIYSVFRVFSTEGWYEIPDLIAERTSEICALLTKLYFVLILFFGGILGMSFINSIFVDAMVSDNNDELEEKVKKLTDKIDELTNEIRSGRNKENF